MTTAQKRWFIALSYVAFIYATLSVVRGPVNYLRSHGVLRLSLTILFLTCLAALLVFLARRGARAWWRYAVVLAVFGAYYAISTTLVKIPEEQIHFFEYGLVGVLFLRAVGTNRPLGWTSLVWALVLSTAAGWIDESIQGLLPSRHYDVRDIVLNAVSAAMGLVIYSVFPRRGPASK